MFTIYVHSYWDISLGLIVLTTLNVTGPRTTDDLLPVSSEAISSQAITSLEVDIQKFSEDDGPIR